MAIVKKSKCKVKEHIWEKKNKRLHECSKGKKKVEDLLELLMRGEKGEIVKDSFDKIQEQEQEQEQEQDDNEEEEVSTI